MTFALDIVSILVGFAVLVKGADWLVDGASSLAKKMGFAAVFIGLTVVAFGTSVPELAVNLIAADTGKTDLAIGNILGSNIANILLILGISSLIFPLIFRKKTVTQEITWAFVALIITGALAFDYGWLSGNGYLSKNDGWALLGVFILFLYYAIKTSREGSVPDGRIKVFPPLKTWGMIVGGLVSLGLGGKLVVDGSVEIARSFGLSEALIGLTIVAIGTSLPELATSAVAAWKHESDIAVGNIVGSNIFNVLFILGITASVAPLPFSRELTTDFFVAALATVALFAAMFVGRKNVLERWQGAMFILAYIAYFTYVISRG